MRISDFQDLARVLGQATENDSLCNKCIYCTFNFYFVCSYKMIPSWLCESFNIVSQVQNTLQARISPSGKVLVKSSFLGVFCKIGVLKGCVCYIFTSLFCMPKREDF